MTIYRVVTTHPVDTIVAAGTNQVVGQRISVDRIQGIGHHARRSGAGDVLSGVVAIGVAHPYRDGCADMRLSQSEVTASGSANSHTVGIPLIAECPQTISVGQLAGVDAQCLVLDSCTIDGDRTRRQVVHVSHNRSGQTCHRLACTLTIGIAGLERDGFANLSLCQRKAVGGRATDVCTSRLPLPGDDPHPICIGQGIATC